VKNIWGKTVYGNVGVDISEEARKIAQDMLRAGEASKIKQREAAAQAHFTSSDPDLFVIGYKRADGSVLVESVEDYGPLGPLNAIGKDLNNALANLNFLIVQRLQMRKICRDLSSACVKAAGIKVIVADILDRAGSTGKISVGAGD
jgi:hypothetical protein